MLQPLRVFLESTDAAVTQDTREFTQITNKIQEGSAITESLPSLFYKCLLILFLTGDLQNLSQL